MIVSKNRRLWAAAIIGLLLITFILLFCIFDALRYRGDGTFADKALFATFPRYEIRFPQVLLAKPGEYTFVSRALPSDSLSFELEMADRHKYDDEMREFFRQYPNKMWGPPKEKDRYPEIKNIRTWVEVRFSTAECPIISKNAGPLKESWILAWVPAVNSGSFWHPNCSDIHFHRNRTYTLAISIKDVDADSPPLMVVPILSGGGIELP